MSWQRLLADGEEAVATVQQKPYDLGLMNAHAENGRRLGDHDDPQDRGPERLVPIVALTGNALVGQRECCLAEGMNDYLSKPFEPADFYAVIDRCSARRRTGSRSVGFGSGR